MSSTVAQNPAAPTKSFRDKLSTIDETGKRVWLYPQRPKGKLYKARTWLSLVYLAGFFGMPLIRVGGHPLFLFNIPERRFILFGQIFWPQDFFIFAIGMLLFVVFVALFTVVFGRLFCGWVCPQTVFMELVFRKIEYWIEGDANQQRVLDQSPWDTNKIVRKGCKWVVFWMLSFLIANTFLAYIIGVDALKKIVTEPVSQHWGDLAAITLFTTVFYLVYLRFREQVCTVVCPYGRLQGVLLDKQSIVVAYDYKRGEQRAKFKKNEHRQSGDCIDCHQCVRVCPTGIDIRNGTQLECVNCTACIDVCNHMMDAVGLPRNLIRYASEQEINTGKQQFWNPRLIAYSVVMLLLLTVEGFLLATRSDVSVNIVRTPGLLFQEQIAAGTISNLYNIKLINKTYADKQVDLRPENFKGRIQLIGNAALRIPKEGYATSELFVFIDRHLVVERKTELQIGVYEDGKRIQRISTSFVGPFKMN